MASSSSVSSQGSQKYDVFLNFRGDDVRHNFLSHLIVAFDHASLNIFVDNKLKRGEHIKSALMDAIQHSKVSLTIFSEGYASSTWCLDELVKIMECTENPMLRQKVIPVFYHVTASDVRNQSGVFAQDFAKHESDRGSHGKVPLWRAAMAAAADLSGRSVKKTSSEAHVLIEIVDDVLTRLGRNYAISNPADNISLRDELRVFLHNLNEKLKDYPNIQQQQRNGSIWTISRQQGLPVQEDLNEFLMSIRGQGERKTFESHSGQRSETSNSQPSPPISYHYGVDLYGLGSTMVPTNPVTQEGLPMSCSTFARGGGNNTNGYGLGGTTVPYSSVSMSNGNCGYRLDLGTGNWGYGYPVDYGKGLPMSSSTFARGGGNNTNGYGLGGTTIPYSSVSMSNGNCGYRLDLGNGNWGYGYPVDYGNGYCGYYVDLGNGNWSYYVDRENGNLYPYEWDVVEQAGQGAGKKLQKLISCLKKIIID